VRRTYDELDEIVVRSQEIFGALGADWKPSRYLWTMPWGGSLKLRYLKRDEDAQRYQGHSYNWLGVDEIGNFATLDPIKRLRATLRDKHGVPVKFRATANPGGVGHAEIKRAYIDPAPPLVPHVDEDTGELRVFIPSRLSDNPILAEADPGYARRLRGSGPAWLVRAWLEGDWNAAPEGGVLKPAWFRRYKAIPEPPDAYMVVHSWDTAYKAQDHNDPSCCQVWVITTTGYYLRDVYVARLDYPALRKKVIEFAERDSPHLVLIEDKASGQSLIQELRGFSSVPARAIEPTADKITRALAVSDMIEAGLVHLPYRAPWLLDFELEISVFPDKTAHDDQVDALTQFLAWARIHAVRRAGIFGSGVKRESAERLTGYIEQPGAGAGRMRRARTRAEGFD
jgi:predicted phage terminase large subunit-like protein